MENLFNSVTIAATEPTIATEEVNVCCRMDKDTEAKARNFPPGAAMD